MRRPSLVIGTLALGAALVLPSAAAAEEHDDVCHVDPTNPICVEGAEGDADPADDVDDVATEEQDEDPSEAADDRPQDETLAATGTEVGPALGVVAALLALGGSLLAATRPKPRPTLS
jgi:hypothetical protein